MKDETKQLLQDQRNEKLAIHGPALINELMEAHYAAGRDNPSISQQVFLAAMEGSGNPIGSVCAALLTTGSKHGPLSETRGLMHMFGRDPSTVTAVILETISNGEKIPGLGNSFFKEGIDPAFQKAYDCYCSAHYDIYPEIPVTLLDKFVDAVNKVRPSDSAPLYANAASITAAICELLNAIPYFENWFFVSARSRAWLELAGQKVMSPE